MIFFTLATQHLAKNTSHTRGLFALTRFADGELSVALRSVVREGQDIWIVAATNSPAENCMELFLLTQALEQQKAAMHLVLTYAGYARQDKQENLQANGARLMTRLLSVFSYKSVTIIHPHSDKIMAGATHIVPYELYHSVAQQADILVAPDNGAHQFALTLGSHVHKPVLLLEKKRTKNGVFISGDMSQVATKKILIVDDMLSTGATAIETASVLKNAGARTVDLLVTHGLFVADAYKDIQHSCIGTVYVTNTIAQQEHDKIKIIEVSEFVQKWIAKQF